jgi:hypothetical protein
MARSEMVFDLSTKTRAAMVVLRVLRPFVALGLLSPARATSIVMRFVRVTVTPARGEGWGGD